jgi:hypothetical protein
VRSKEGAEIEPCGQASEFQGAGQLGGGFVRVKGEAAEVVPLGIMEVDESHSAGHEPSTLDDDITRSRIGLNLQMQAGGLGRAGSCTGGAGAHLVLGSG